jgi:hypothetical protein
LFIHKFVNFVKKLLWGAPHVPRSSNFAYTSPVDLDLETICDRYTEHARRSRRRFRRRRRFAAAKFAAASLVAAPFDPAMARLAPAHCAIVAPAGVRFRDSRRP